MGKSELNYLLAEGRGTVTGLAAELEDFGTSLGWSVKYIFQLNLVLDEVITNALSYGYDDPATHEITVDMALKDQFFRITVTDNAAPFDPLEESPAPELHTPLEQRRHIGGMGVHIMKTLMDEVRYERKDGKNVLTMQKDIRNCRKC